MALLIQRVVKGLLPAMDANRAPVRHERPDRIVFGVRPGYPPSGKPPVRIFLGSERNQFRAERVFLWSVAKHRDPGRVYEIHLMKDLLGFQGRFWLTGFTNYRFAIPMFCAFEGRAIYNDTDQIYLRDPAELFDQNMGDAGFLSINDRDTSVMLIDCERMADAWNRQALYASSRKALEARARSAGLWGAMEGIWNARDREYVPGQSACVHFTTLHTQPWRPFPDYFVYFSNPTGHLWPDLEDEADAARFMPVSATRPSRDWPEAALALSSRPDGTELLALLGPHGSALSPSSSMVVENVLEWVPDADLPWVLERFFSVCETLEVRLREPLVSRPGRLRRSRHFWQQQFDCAAALHPATQWVLRQGRHTMRGGPPDTGAIQVLTHGKPGHNHQALALANALGRISEKPVEVTPLPTSPAWLVTRRLLGFKPPAVLYRDAAVIVAAGWMPSRVARWLARGRNLRIVTMGRKSGPAPEHSGVVVGCRHFGLPSHPNRIDTLLPLNAGQLASAQSDRSPWQQWLEPARHKRFAVLVGGESRSHEFTDDDARMLARTASSWAARHNAKLLMVTSRRTHARLDALRDQLDPAALLYTWQPDDDANPYGLALHNADALLVTGESESMLADAVNSGKPVRIWPLRQRAPGVWRRLSDRIVHKATAPRYNRRGSIRPQQGLTYICARLLERQWILPGRDIEALHNLLIDAGLAKRFEPSESVPDAGDAPAFNELQATAESIAARLGLVPPNHQPDFPGSTSESVGTSTP